MDILKAEIARKRRLLEDKNLVTEQRKYFRQSELTNSNRADCARRSGLTATSSLVSGERVSPSTDDIIDSDAQPNVSSDGTVSQPARADVVRRLRDRLEPVLLFGESEWQAWRRLRRLEIIEPEITRGLRNDFQEAMEKVDRAYLNEMLRNNTNSQEQSKSAEEDCSVTWQEIELATENLRAGGTSDALNCQVLLKLYKFLLSSWNKQIQSEPSSERCSMRVKTALATYQQTQNYLRPLFRQLRSNTLSADILDALIEIAQHMVARDYIKASDAYLQMAIGNAAWPIGVTMVGIHARTGREKIFSRHVAHVLNDETQRKYIQALKRLMTKCQELFPTDPSRSVEYGALTAVKKTDR